MHRRVQSALLLVLFAATLHAADFYVATTGSASADGSKATPWDFKTALAGGGGKIQPGDTIWLRGGTYGTGGATQFYTSLNGTATALLTFRGYPGERAIVDGGIRTQGSYLCWRGFEITNSSQKRTCTPGERPSGLNIESRTPSNGWTQGCKVINMVVHNTGHPGIGFWNQRDGGEIYGCLVFANGIYDNTNLPPWTRGSGTYTQNDMGDVYITDNIWLWHFTTGINAYGEGGKVLGYHAEGNIGINDKDRSLWFATAPKSTPNEIDRLFVTNNYTWTNPSTASNHNKGGAQCGYKGDNLSATFKDNYIVAEHNGTTGMLFMRKFTPQTVTGNTVVGPGVLGDDAEGGTAQVSTWNNNHYHGGSGTPGKPFHYASSLKNIDAIYTWDEWKRNTGFDANSTFSSNFPTANKVFVRANKYDKGRGHIAVYNWEKKTAVSVDIAAFGLQNGQSFEVRDSQNYFGTPVLSGTFSGAAISIPMNHSTSTPIAQINGKAEITHMELLHSPQEFGAFIVLPGTVGAPVPPSIITQPSHKSVDAGKTATFTVVASGTAPLSYQWQKNGTNISGATSTSYTTPATTTADNGATFRCVVTNSAGSATSNSATLTVNPPPNQPPLISSPASALPNPALVGQSVSLTVAASDADGNVLSYAWNFGDGATASGAATTHIYAAAGNYNASVTVSDGLASVSSSVNVTVTAPGTNTVTVTKAGQPVVGVYVYAFSSTDTSLNLAVMTNSLGRATFSLASGLSVKYRVSNEGAFFWSAIVTTPQDAAITVPASTLVTVQKAGVPLSGLFMYAYDAAGTYLNYYRQTDANGRANFAISNGQQVKFRVADQGTYFWSAIITAPATTTIAVPANTTVTVQKAGAPIAGVYIYAYDATGNYLNYYRLTDASGRAVFALGAAPQVKFRVSDQGTYFWSAVITPPTATTIAVPANTTVTVQKAGAALTGLYVYAFDAAGNYLNYARQTNASGQAIFALASGLQVQFRVSSQGAYFWSALITTPQAVSIAVPGDTTVILQQGTTPVAGVYVYAYTSAGASLGYSRPTDAGGKALFALASGLQVKFSASLNSQLHWSTVITAPGTVTITASTVTAAMAGAAVQPEPELATAVAPEQLEPQPADLGTVQLKTQVRMKLELPEELAGQRRVTWKVANPAQLPPGVSLSRGKLGGRPSAAGLFVFRVTVEATVKTVGVDGKKRLSKQSVERLYQLRVAQ